jgi:hypothetical protein
VFIDLVFAVITKGDLTLLLVSEAAACAAMA